MALVYTNIQHQFRKRNKLTNNEYVFCDMIFYLCKATLSKIPGWCYMTKEKQGEELGISKQSVMQLSKKMVEAGFLEKQDVTGFLRTTAKWEMVYFTVGKESLPEENNPPKVVKHSLPINGKESLPNNSNINNINHNKKESDLFSKDDIKSLPEEILLYLNEKKGGRGFEMSVTNLSPIKARLKEKFYTVEDFKKVVDAMIIKWSNDMEMKGYLRPETLFGKKFNGYLIDAEAIITKANKSGSKNFKHEPSETAMLNEE